MDCVLALHMRRAKLFSLHSTCDSVRSYSAGRRTKRVIARCPGRNERPVTGLAGTASRRANSASRHGVCTQEIRTASGRVEGWRPSGVLEVLQRSSFFRIKGVGSAIVYFFGMANMELEFVSFQFSWKFPFSVRAQTSSASPGSNPNGTGGDPNGNLTNGSYEVCILGGLQSRPSIQKQQDQVL